MGLKGFLKGLGKGGVVVAKGALAVAGSDLAEVLIGALPDGAAAVKALRVLSRAVDAYQAQSDIPNVEKAELVTFETLQALEAETGKNFDNPKTRGAVRKIVDLDVKVKQFAAELALAHRELHELVQSVTEPAQADTTV